MECSTLFKLEKKTMFHLDFDPFHKLLTNQGLMLKGVYTKTLYIKIQIEPYFKIVIIYIEYKKCHNILFVF